jgi:hypothetical protein
MIPLNECAGRLRKLHPYKGLLVALFDISPRGLNDFLPPYCCLQKLQLLLLKLACIENRRAVNPVNK